MITFHTPLETGDFMGIDFQILADDLSTSAARLVVVGTFIYATTVNGMARTTTKRIITRGTVTR